MKVARVERLPDCHPGFDCWWHGTCSECGETIHLAHLDTSPGFGPVHHESFARLIVGDPPRCVDCRQGARPT